MRMSRVGVAAAGAGRWPAAGFQLLPGLLARLDDDDPSSRGCASS